MRAAAQDVPPPLDEKAIEQFLLQAKVVRTRAAGKGITGSIRATLTDGTLTHDAQIQTIDEYKREFQGPKGIERDFRDSWTFNVAAYRVARLDEMAGGMPHRHEQLTEGAALPLVHGAWLTALAFSALNAWLLRSRLFGPLLRDWQERRGVRRRVKVVAIAIIPIAILFSIYVAQLSWPLVAVVVVLALIGIVVIILLPEVKDKKEDHSQEPSDF